MKQKNFQEQKDLKILLSFWQECGLIDHENYKRFIKGFENYLRDKKRKAN